MVAGIAPTTESAADGGGPASGDGDGATESDDVPDDATAGDGAASGAPMLLRADDAAPER